MSARILIIDGNKQLLLNLKDYFSKEGFSVVISQNGATALALVNSEKPDVIISEVFLPDIDGIELCRRIRDISTVPDVPYIFLTSVNDFLIENRAFRAGGTEFLVKRNITKQELLLKLELELHHNSFSTKIERYSEMVFAGRIGDIELWDVVRFINEERLTGGLELFIVDRKGVIYFERGEITDAFYMRRSGFSALNSLTEENNAVFRFTKYLFTRNRSIHEKTLELIKNYSGKLLAKRINSI
jgi:CheY-like chemotaxis protein